MHQATLKALQAAVAAIGREIGDMTDDWVNVIQYEGDRGVDFWNTKYGWIHAFEDRDGSYWTATTEAYRKRGGMGGVVGRNLDKVAFMGGVPTYKSPAAAIRAHFGEAA